MKDAVLLGGPNGAGKTTAASVIVRNLLGIQEFVNADEIARGLSPFNTDVGAIAAGHLMIERMNALADARESFAFETTCAARGHAQFLRKCRGLGYRLTLVFLWLPSPAAAIARVAQRVSEGGHNIPQEVVKRRYFLGLRNMRQIYFPLVDCALVYYNSEHGLVKIAERQADTSVIVHDEAHWRSIEDTARDGSHD